MLIYSYTFICWCRLTHIICAARNLHKWVQRLKAELPYYDECNTGICLSLFLV